MNADDRGPAGEAKPPFIPVSGEAPVRREGLIPPSGSVPQRTAFRSVTGTTPTTARPGTPAQASPPAQSSSPAGVRPATYAPPATHGAPRSPQSAPRVPMPETSRPAAGTAPSSFAPGRPGAPTTGSPSAFAPTGAPTTGAPSAFAPTTGAPATDVQTTHTGVSGAASAAGAAARSVAGSLGLGRLKGVATEMVNAKDTKVPIPGAPRKVRVLVSRVDPWSALKIGFLVSIAFGVMTVVAVWILWNTLNQMEVFVTIQEWVSKLFTPDQEVNILQFFAPSKVMSATVLVAVVNVVLISGLSVIAAFIYNMISRVVGGVYMTLTDD